MKLKFWIIVASCLATSFLTAVIALKACDDGQLFGGCTASDRPCTAVCPSCGQGFYPVPDRDGMGRINTGDCPICDYCFDTEQY